MRVFLLILCVLWTIDAAVIVVVCGLRSDSSLWGTLVGILAASGAITLATLCWAVRKIGWAPKPNRLLAELAKELRLSSDELALASRTELPAIVSFHRAGKNDVVFDLLAGRDRMMLEQLVAILGRSPSFKDLCLQVRALCKEAAEDSLGSEIQ